MLHVSAVFVRILFLSALAKRDRLHGHCKSGFHGLRAVLDDRLCPCAELIPGFHGVGIRKEANLMCYAFQLLKLCVRPCRSKRGDRIDYTYLLKPHAVRRSLDGIHLLLLGRYAPGSMEAEEHIPLMIDRCVSTIEVFRLRRASQIPSCVVDDTPHAVLYRNHDT